MDATRDPTLSPLFPPETGGPPKAHTPIHAINGKRDRATKSYRIFLSSPAAVAAPTQGNNNVAWTFRVDLPGAAGMTSTPYTGPYAFIIETFNCSQVPANAGLANKAYMMRMQSSQQPRNRYEPRSDQSVYMSDIVATLRGHSYAFPSPTLDAMGMEITNLSVFCSQPLTISFTNLDGTPVTDLTDPSSQWCATILVWEL
jgi:hypothetical protein